MVAEILKINILMKTTALALIEAKILVSWGSARKIVADSRSCSKSLTKLPNMPQNPRSVVNKAFFAARHFTNGYQFYGFIFFTWLSD